MSTRDTSLRWIYQTYQFEPALSAVSGGQLVLGEGPDPAETAIFIGEAPGRTEDSLARPFVGRAGVLLDSVLADAGLPREECYLTNVLKYRPTGPDGKDRPPTESEILVSLPYLWRELALVSGRCRVICTLGRTATQALTGRSRTMGSEAGHWRLITDPAGIRYAHFATYHPAAALRSKATERFIRRDLAALSDQVHLFGQRAAALLA